MKNTIKELTTCAHAHQINKEKLLNKSVKIKNLNKEYVIVNTYDYGVYLCLTMIDKNQFNETAFEHESNYAQELGHGNYLNRLNRMNIDAVCIAIDNPLLRDSRYSDFCIYYDKYGPFDAPFNWDYSINNGPFATFINDKNNVITNIKDLRFPPFIKQLRKLLANAMPADIKEEYLKEYKDYCLTTIKQLLKENTSLINRRLKALQAEENSLNSKKDKYYKALLEIETKNNDSTL